MLVIRLRRIGKKKQPTYRVVVAEHTAAVQGSFVEDLGFYNPHVKQISIDADKATDWMNKGAKPSNTVAKLLEKEKVKHKSVVVTKFKKAPKKVAEEKVAKPAAPTAEADQTETAVEASEVTENTEAVEESAPAEEAAAPEAEVPAAEDEKVEPETNATPESTDEPAEPAA